MKLILHIGTDKTGTTAIQMHVHANREWLLDKGVFVPLTGFGKDNGHSKLLRTLGSDGLSEVAKELAAAEVEGYDCALLSWEGMSYMSSQEIVQLVNTLRLDNVWLLVYLREQADITQTGYLQQIKTDGSPVTIKDFERGVLSPRGFRARMHCYSRSRNYSRMLQRWMRVIKRGRVIVREFQRDKLVKGSVVDDFLSALGLSRDHHFRSVEHFSNPSLDVESAILLNRFDNNSRATACRKTMSFSLQSLVDSEGPGTRYFLTPERVAAIRQHYKRSNAAIADIIGAELSPLFQTPPDCATTETFSSLSAQVEMRASKLAALTVIPMLFATKKPHRRPSQEMLITGWGAIHEGAWSVGETSLLRFRLPFWMSTRPRGEVVVFLKGRYTKNNSKTQVKVNSVDFGWQNLSAFSGEIRLPASCLGNNQTLEVKLRHELQEPTPSRAPGMELSALQLRRIGIQFFHPD
ncbi:MAG: hypothetical protein GY813_08225 [Halieaceae bacterium]|nr:hypothetical protein [Halieaceae bacterium]